MMLKTMCYGEIDVNERRCITFPRGILGFPQYRDYLLIPNEQDRHTYWLQSIQLPELAIKVVDPGLYVSDYARSIRGELVKSLGIRSLREIQLLVIVDQHGDRLTANLRAPLVVSLNDRLGEQYVLCASRYSTRTSLSERAGSNTKTR